MWLCFQQANVPDRGRNTARWYNFGTMSNLWGDGYEDSAKSIASFVVKCFE